MKTKIEYAIQYAAKFTNLAAAKRWRDNRIDMRPTIILGDDGRFWVPATNRDAGILMKAGYEAAE
ncbi:MAG: hypothetical protein N2690_03565 [Rhodocyclaceae bacterium]|nr:hypothetical protein [Rhodocyclaceae bacterium]